MSTQRMPVWMAFPAIPRGGHWVRADPRSGDVRGLSGNLGPKTLPRCHEVDGRPLGCMDMAILPECLKS